MMFYDESRAFSSRCKGFGCSLRKSDHPVFFQGMRDFSCISGIKTAPHFCASFVPCAFNRNRTAPGKKTAQQGFAHRFSSSHKIDIGERIEQVNWKTEFVLPFPFYGTKNMKHSNYISKIGLVIA